jgi:hypothetical protein
VSYTDNRGAVDAIRQAAQNVGGDVWPDDLADELDRIDQAVATVPGDRDGLAGTVYAAALDGRDPADDPEVRAALTHHLLAQAVPRTALAAQASDARHHALERHAGAMVDRLRAAVTTADLVLTRTRDTVPHFDPRDPHQAGHLDPHTSKQWAEGRDAATLVGHATTCWRQLYLLLRNGPPSGRAAAALLVADLDADQLNALGHQPDHLDVIAAGHELNLATFDEVAERTERIANQQEAIREHHADGFRREWRRTHHVGQLT